MVMTKGLTEQGMLPIGVEFEGKTHREFEIREQLVVDTVEVLEDRLNGARALESDSFFNVCIAAKRVIKLGDIPKEKITPELFLGMKQKDLGEISSASARLVEKRRRFRTEDDTCPQDNTGTA